MKATDEIIEKCIGGEPPRCEAACPLHLDVRGYVGAIRQGNYDEALAVIRRALPFPGIMGRICTRFCERKCQRNEIDEPIAIEYLKRAAAEHGEAAVDLSIGDEKDEKAAIIGGGPAGLLAAYDLRKMGYRVTIFEASATLGGMLSRAIPAYRLPEDVVREELRILEMMGIEVRLNTKVGLDVKLTAIREHFDAVFFAPGMTLSRKLDLEGMNLQGVEWGLDFLIAVKTDQPVQMKERVVVIGGGNVAVDVALAALRLGAKSVDLACLESREEMPAFDWEIEQAVEEGVNLHVSWGPKKILGDGGSVSGIELVRCISVFDDRGRFNPAFDGGVTTVLPADTVIVAIGQAVDLCCIEESAVALTGTGLIAVDPDTLQTSIPGIFAGGDAVAGPGAVVEAMAAGRKAARSMDRYMRGESPLVLPEHERGETGLVVSLEGVARKERCTMPYLPVEERQGNFREIELGLNKEQAAGEADRCLQCECKVCLKECEFLTFYNMTPRELALKFRDGSFKESPQIPYSCNVCDLCKRLCPKELSTGDMCMEVREEMVATGLGPLSQHKLVVRDQEWSTSDSVTLVQSDPAIDTCTRVFFPGCGLSGYSPELVMKLYNHLRGILPGTGIVLGCCGGPTHFLGDRGRFHEIVGEVASRMEEVGASELIVACPDCYHTLKEFFGDRLRNVYEILQEHGLPENIRSQAGEVFSLHDSCKVRWEKGWHEDVRFLIKAMGHRIEEMEYSRDKTRCCGLGGMAPYVDFRLAGKVTKKRADEAAHDIVTYCASCREALAMHKPAVHILELIYNPDWEQGKSVPPKTGKARRENQARLKTMLQTQVNGKPKE